MGGALQTGVVLTVSSSQIEIADDDPKYGNSKYAFQANLLDRDVIIEHVQTYKLDLHWSEVSREELVALGVKTNAEVVAVATGENRPPKTGEWFIVDGGRGTVQKCSGDFSYPHQIARLVRKA